MTEKESFWTGNWNENPIKDVISEMEGSIDCPKLVSVQQQNSDVDTVQWFFFLSPNLGLQSSLSCLLRPVLCCPSGYA